MQHGTNQELGFGYGRIGNRILGAKRGTCSGWLPQADANETEMNWLDDIKVGLASATGLGNWLIQMDILIKVGISLVTFLYVTKKCIDLYKGKK